MTAVIVSAVLSHVVIVGTWLWTTRSMRRAPTSERVSTPPPITHMVPTEAERGAGVTSEDVTDELLALARAKRRDEELARRLVPWKPIGGVTLDAVRQGVARALAVERERAADELERTADNYEFSGRTETDWLSVSHAFRSAAERVREGGPRD